MNDTNPEIAALVREKVLERSGAERIMMASGMFEAAKAMILASFPVGLTEIEVKRRLVERIYGDEVDVEGFVAHLRSLHSDPAANQPPK
jgi:Holliday junction resolvase